MAVDPTTVHGRGSFLLGLLHYAGWHLEIQETELVRIHAFRDGVEVDVSGASLPEAAGTAFARAMRSGTGRQGDEG